MNRFTFKPRRSLSEPSRLNLPDTAPEGEDEMYTALVALGGAIAAAEQSGLVTELVRPDGSVAARIVPGG
jgi:hypothetical protein